MVWLVLATSAAVFAVVVIVLPETFRLPRGPSPGSAAPTEDEARGAVGSPEVERDLVSAPGAAGGSMVAEEHTLVPLRVVLQGLDDLPRSLRHAPDYRITIEPEGTDVAMDGVVAAREEVQAAGPATVVPVAPGIRPPGTRYVVHAVHEHGAAVGLGAVVVADAPAVVFVDVKLAASALVVLVGGAAEALRGRAVLVGASRNRPAEVESGEAVFTVEGLPDGEYELQAYGEQWIAEPGRVLVSGDASTPDRCTLELGRAAVIIIDVAAADGSPATAADFAIMSFDPGKRLWGFLSDADPRPGVPFFWPQGSRLVVHGVTAGPALLVRPRGLADYLEVGLVAGVTKYSVRASPAADLVFEGAPGVCEAWLRRHPGGKAPVFLDMGVDIAGTELGWVTLEQRRIDGSDYASQPWRIRGNPRRRFRLRIHGEGGYVHEPVVPTVLPR